MGKKKVDSVVEVVETEEAPKKSKGISNLVEFINKEFGDGAIFNVGQMPTIKMPRISTGNVYLDRGLGGGLPLGRIHLIVGPKSSGKSYFTNKVAAEFTKLGKKVAIVEPECTFDIDWAKSCGIDTDLLFVARGGCQERDIDILELLVASGEYDLVILDSIAAMIPQAIKDDKSEKAHVGIEARLNNRMFKKILSHQADFLTKGVIPPTVIVVNQIRYKIGVMFGSPETTPGGEGQNFYSSIILDFRAKETILDAKDDVVGMKFQYTVKKNKTAPRCKPSTVRMFVADYMGMKAGDWDSLDGIIELATDLEVIEKGGRFYENKNGNVLSKKFMYKQLWDKLRDDKSCHDAMVKEIKKIVPSLEYK